MIALKVLGIIFIAIILLVVFACCKVAGDADALEEEMLRKRQLGNDKKHTI